MAISDVFVLVFETNGSQAVVKEFAKVQKAADSAAKSAGNSAVFTQKAEKGFIGLKNGVVKALAPLAAFGVILNRTLNFANQGEGLLFMANSATVAAERFTALAMAAERLGGSRAGMAASLGSLSSSLMGIRRGEENGLTQAAMYYGVRFYGPSGGVATPEEMLENIARAMEGRSAAEQMDMGRMLGLDDGTIRLLQGGVRGLRQEMALAKKYNPFDEKTLKNVQDFQYSLRELKAAFAMVAGQFLRDLIPHFKRWAEMGKETFDFLINHSDEVKLAMAAIGAVILGAFGPLYLLGGLLILLVDDFATFARGGESALEPLWKMIMSIRKGLEFIKELLHDNMEQKISDAQKRTFFWQLPKVDKDGNVQKGKNILSMMSPGSGSLLDRFTQGLLSPIFNNQIEINVSESGDPQKTVNAVSSGLQRSGILEAEDALATAQAN